MIEVNEAARPGRCTMPAAARRASRLSRSRMNRPHACADAFYEQTILPAVVSGWEDIADERAATRDSRAWRAQLATLARWDTMLDGRWRGRGGRARDHAAARGMRREGESPDDAESQAQRVRFAEAVRDGARSDPLSSSYLFLGGSSDMLPSAASCPGDAASPDALARVLGSIEVRSTEYQRLRTRSLDRSMLAAAASRARDGAAPSRWSVSRRTSALFRAHYHDHFITGPTAHDSSCNCERDPCLLSLTSPLRSSSRDCRAAICADCAPPLVAKTRA